MNSPSPDLIERLQPYLRGRTPVAFRRAAGGYTPAERWLVDLDDGTSFFLKTGAGVWARRLRLEHDAYSRLDAPILPRLLAWLDDGARPVLVLEDLSAAFWPPPWTSARIDAVLRALDAIHAAAPSDFRSVDDFVAGFLDHWPDVASDPGGFLALGLCSAAWLSRSLPMLAAAAASIDLAGRDLLHNDVRSDNICFLDDRVVLIDWDCACVGSSTLDTAQWLPSLHAEGGPLPETILPGAPGWAAAIAGYFAFYAGEPAIPNAPRVRNIQLEQLRSALPWAVRALGLPPLDGPNEPLP